MFLVSSVRLSGRTWVQVSIVVTEMYNTADPRIASIAPWGRRREPRHDGNPRSQMRGPVRCVALPSAHQSNTRRAS